MINRTLTILTTAAIAAIATANADAAVPDFMTQQGRLLDATGAPINGELSFVFSVYDAATEGAVLWTETTNVTLDEGFFTVQLGSATALDTSIFDGSTRYLGVRVGADEEMSPRQAMVAAPYAFAANTADSALTAVNATGNITPTSVSVNGSPVINASGVWVGAQPAIDFGSLISVVEATSADSAMGGRISVTATCGSGKVATGGGCALTNAGAQSARLKASEPTVAAGVATGFTCTCDADWEESFTIQGTSTIDAFVYGTTCAVRARAICVPDL
jgi:hypothetical protein